MSLSSSDLPIIIAIGHIIGAIVVHQIIALPFLFIDQWLRKLSQNKLSQEISIKLGIPISELDNKEHQERIIQYRAEKCSPELLRNRLADLWYWIEIGLAWIGLILLVCFLLGVIWFTITDNLSNAVYAWFIIAAWFLLWMSAHISSYACELITGRKPGEPSQTRKHLSEIIEKSHNQYLRKSP